MKIETITFIGLILTFIVGIANIIISLNNARKSTFINSVTTSRIKYIQELRTSIAQFCGMISASNNTQKLELPDFHKLEIEANRLKYLIRLYLNPEDKYWDEEIILLIDDIAKTDIDSSKDMGDLKQKTEKLIILTQYLLKLEWEGAKIESKKGILSDLEKKELYNKYIQLHKKHIDELNQKLPRQVWG